MVGGAEYLTGSSEHGINVFAIAMCMNNIDICVIGLLFYHPDTIWIDAPGGREDDAFQASLFCEGGQLRVGISGVVNNANHRLKTVTGRA